MEMGLKWITLYSLLQFRHNKYRYIVILQQKHTHMTHTYIIYIYRQYRHHFIIFMFFLEAFPAQRPLGQGEEAVWRRI